jgi:glucosamine-6-phosphate deaminase
MVVNLTTVSGMAEQRRVDQLDVAVHADGASLARAAADDVVRHLSMTLEVGGVASAMFATGDSQLAVLDDLAARVHELDWSRVVVFHMDEYVGLGADHPASFRRYIRERLADRLDPGAVYYLDGTADPATEARRYADLLLAHPLDLCVLGVGENGHLAFNDPPVADFEDAATVKVVELDEASRRQQVGEGHFATVDDVPTHALTVTIPALLSAERVVAVVPERRKADAVRRALTQPVSTACPASVLRHQPHATLHLDRESASLL